VPDNDDPKKTRAYKKQDGEKEIPESDDVGPALKTLSSQLGSFLDEIKSQRDTDNRERHTDRYRQWWVTRIELGVAFFTLLVLALTYGVYNKILTTENTQATIMSNQATIMDKQRNIADKQATNLARQLDDAEKVQAARLVIEDLKYTITSAPPNLTVKVENCVVKNVGSSVADQITFTSGGAGGRVNPKSPDYDPRTNSVFTTPNPSPSGFSLAQGTSRPCPIIGDSSGGGIPGDAKVWMESYYVAISYVDIFKKSHITSECRIMWLPSDNPTLETCTNGSLQQ